MKTKRKLPEYDFSKPIKLLQYKAPRFDIIFYSFLLSAMMMARLSGQTDEEARLDFEGSDGTDRQRRKGDQKDHDACLRIVF